MNEFYDRYDERQKEQGQTYYEALGIAREDQEGRKKKRFDNWFFSMRRMLLSSSCLPLEIMYVSPLILVCILVCLSLFNYHLQLTMHLSYLLSDQYG